METKVQYISTILKGLLEAENLYIGVNSKTEKFFFVNRDEFHKGVGKVYKVKMNEINISK